MNPNRSLIDFLANNYATYRETQQLWTKVDGNAARVLDMETPRTRWTNLLQQVNAGAVDRINLVLAALEDFPGSAVLLNDLARHLPEDIRAQAKGVIEALTQSPPSSLEEANEVLIPLEFIPAETASAAVAVELSQAAEGQKEQAKSLGRLAAEKTVETVVAEGTRVFLHALPLLGPFFSGTAA